MIGQMTSTIAFGVRGEECHLEVVEVQEEVFIRRDKTEFKMNCDTEKIAKSPIDINVLKRELSYYSHPDKQIICILKGVTEGFSLHYSGPHISSEATNLKTSRQHPLVVRQNIYKELALKRVTEPFSNIPIDSLRVSLIGIIPKKKPGEFRLIHVHHISHLAGQSVNDFIDQELCIVRYTQFDEAVYMLQDLGKRCKLESRY